MLPGGELLAVSLMVSPLHTGELEDTVGTAGFGLMTTSMVSAKEVQLLSVTFTQYFPLCAGTTVLIDGLGELLEKGWGRPRYKSPR